MPDCSPEQRPRLLVSPGALALCLVLLLGFGLRVRGLDFGLPGTHCRPDESTLVNKALSIAGGDLNPHFFAYPSLLFYLLAGVYGAAYCAARAVGAVAGVEQVTRLFFTDPTPFYLVGRLVSAAAGTASVALVYALGRRLGTTRAGLLAALFLSAALLHVRDSHFITVDVAATCLVLFGCLLAMRYWRSGRLRDLGAGSVVFGLAASTKYNAVLLAGPILVGTILARELRCRGVWRPVLLAACLGTVGFVVGTPYGLLDWTSFRADLSTEARHFTTGHAAQTGLGPGWLYHLTFSLRLGLGTPLLLAALVGLAFWARDRDRPVRPLVAGVLLYFAVAGSGNALFVRYMVPLVPLLCLAAGDLCARMRGRGQAWAVPVAALLVLPTLWSSWQHTSLLARTDTRVLAGRWIEENLPSGSTVALAGSDFADPVIKPSRACLERRLAEAHAAGLPGRRLAAMLAIPGYPPAPTYDLRRIASSAGAFDELEHLRHVGPLAVVVPDHPLAYSRADPALVAVLEDSATLVFELKPLVPRTAGGVYDPLDAYYVPLSGYAQVHRPGPGIRIYWYRE